MNIFRAPEAMDVVLPSAVSVIWDLKYHSKNKKKKINLENFQIKTLESVTIFKSPSGKINLVSIELITEDKFGNFD